MLRKAIQSIDLETILRMAIPEIILNASTPASTLADTSNPPQTSNGARDLNLPGSTSPGLDELDEIMRIPNDMMQGGEWQHSWHE